MINSGKFHGGEDAQAQPSSYIDNPILPSMRSPTDPIYDNTIVIYIDEDVTDSNTQPPHSIKQQCASSEYSFRPIIGNQKSGQKQGKRLRWQADQVPCYRPMERPNDMSADSYENICGCSPPIEHQDREMRRHQTKHYSKSSEDFGRDERAALRTAKIQKEKMLSQIEAERSLQADSLYLRMRDVYTKKGE